MSRLEALVEKLIKQQTKTKSKHHRAVRVVIKPKSLPEFTPGNPNLSSAKWIAKLEGLAKTNNWDDPTMIFLMQSRLGGLARRRYDNLSTLRALVNRKLPTESWERYYFDKVQLTNACHINIHRVVSRVVNY